MFSVLFSGGHDNVQVYGFNYVLSTTATHRIVYILCVYYVLMLSKTFIHSFTRNFWTDEITRKDYTRTNTRHYL